MGVPSFLLAAQALLAAGPPACGHPALGLDLGVGLEAVSDSELRPAFVGAAVAGWDLRDCFNWPLRAEASFGSGTRGPPWWDGVEAVAVRSWHLELAVGLGVNVPFWNTDDGAVELGADLLAGGVLRLIGVATRVQEQENVTHVPRGLARVLAGLFLRVASWRLHLRIDWLFELEPGFLMGAGYEL